LIDFKLGMILAIKAENDLHNVGWSQVAMHCNCHNF